jgi:hypothetical protein
MGDYSQEKWMSLYREALLELKQSLMTGRILEARNEIIARLGKLTDVSELQAEERRAIADAVHGLRSLEIEHDRYAAAKLAEATLRNLQMLEPKILRLDSPGGND